MDNLHKVSHQLVSDYNTIALEDLNVKGMVKTHKLAKHISDASWELLLACLNIKRIGTINRLSKSIVFTQVLKPDVSMVG